jgi:hypothetical protein
VWPPKSSRLVRFRHQILTSNSLKGAGRPAFKFSRLQLPGSRLVGELKISGSNPSAFHQAGTRLRVDDSQSSLIRRSKTKDFFHTTPQVGVQKASVYKVTLVYHISLPEHCHMRRRESETVGVQFRVNNLQHARNETQVCDGE